ncbi:MAG TPA: hypothetical protein VE442_05515 [Jatrophihabitans sp.]|jgi:hypothetical protein|nr:hypothetical protein [Jatrophihabitans sp.]
MPSPDDNLTVTFPARLWAPVDATIDNSVSMARVDDDSDTYEAGHRLREAGWAAMKAAPETNELGWPQDDYHMPITAIRSDWVFLLTQLDRWEPHSGRDESWFYIPARQTIESALQA